MVFVKSQLLQVFSLAGLLSIVNLEFLRIVLEKYYAQIWRWKKFDCVSMLRLTIFRIVKRKNRCAVIRYLKLALFVLVVNGTTMAAALARPKIIAGRIPFCSWPFPSGRSMNHTSPFFIRVNPACRALKLPAKA